MKATFNDARGQSAGLEVPERSDVVSMASKLVERKIDIIQRRGRKVPRALIKALKDPVLVEEWVYRQGGGSYFIVKPHPSLVVGSLHDGTTEDLKALQEQCDEWASELTETLALPYGRLHR